LRNQSGEEKMKENLKNYFKPTWGKLFLALAYVSWQYFYNYQGANIPFSADISSYLTTGLAYINWGNFFIKNLSLVGIWILLALVIYAVIFGFELVSNSLHNARVKKEYQNTDPADYQHKLKTREVFLKTHLVAHLIWTGGIIMILLGFFFVSPQLEALRFSIYDRLFWAMVEGGVTLEYNNLTFTIFSFVSFLPLWYLYTSLVFFSFQESKLEEEKEEITEEHYAVVVDDATPDETES
jgi:hypothetical protein